MKALLITHKGLEKTSLKEAKKLVDAKEILSGPGFAIIEIKDEKTLSKLTYNARTIMRTILLLDEQDSQDIPSISKIDIKKYLGETAVVRCERTGEHNYTSFDCETQLNGQLKTKYDIKIDHKHPQTIIFCYINVKKSYIGIDFAGIDLGRRDYRIFLSRESLKGSFASGLLQLANYQEDQKIMDPFCREGIIPIEAALYRINSSVHAYCKEKLAFTKIPNCDIQVPEAKKQDKSKIYCLDSNFKNVSASKKNAKIAGVIKQINFSRLNLEWLDTKFEKNDLDLILTMPTQLSKRVPEAKIQKTYNQLFYQAEFLLTPKGKLGLLMRQGVELLEPLATKYKFEIDSTHKLNQGNENFTFIIYKKIAKKSKTKIQAA